VANTTRNIPWARLGFESVLIVVSILLAFAIERWWSDRQASIEEQALLRQLKVEFEDNASRLVEKRSEHQEVRDAGLRLLSVMGPDARVEDLGIETIREDFGALMYLRTFDPGTGTLSTIIQSGKLDLISSDDLRTNLSAWPARYQDLSEDEQWVIEVSMDRVAPYFVEFATMRNFYIPLSEIRPSLFPEEFEIMLRDRKFENIVASKTRITTSTLNAFDQTKLLLDETLALIQSQIH